MVGASDRSSHSYDKDLINRYSWEYSQIKCVRSPGCDPRSPFTLIHFQENKFSLNPEKYMIWVTSMRLLGHIVHKEGILVDRMKFGAIVPLPPPSNVKGLKKILEWLHTIEGSFGCMPGLCWHYIPYLRKKKKMNGWRHANIFVMKLKEFWQHQNLYAQIGQWSFTSISMRWMWP